MKKFSPRNITKIIHEKHNEFVKKFEPFMDKIEAETELDVEKIDAKIKLVLQNLQEETVIDRVIENTQDINTKNPYSSHKSYYIYKCGHHFGIQLIVTSTSVFLKSVGVQIEAGILGSEKKVFRNVNSEDFDWELFTKDLLEYIHRTIYQGEKLLACILFGN